MFTIFNAHGEPTTIVATETYAWAVMFATFGKGVEYPTGKFYVKPPAFDLAQVNLMVKLAATIGKGQLRRGYAGLD